MDTPTQFCDEKEGARETFTDFTLSKGSYHENKPKPKADIEVESDDAGNGDKAEDRENVAQFLENKKDNTRSQLEKRNNPPIFIKPKV